MRNHPVAVAWAWSVPNVRAADTIVQWSPRRGSDKIRIVCQTSSTAIAGAC